MVSDMLKRHLIRLAHQVLILVVMEDGLWCNMMISSILLAVLILVVMEDGLWSLFYWGSAPEGHVLILVVMEDGLWSVKKVLSDDKEGSLNPCCNGRWSLIISYRQLWEPKIPVLILVVMEDGLWFPLSWFFSPLSNGLNPCCNGRWSLIAQAIGKLLDGKTS